MVVGTTMNFRMRFESNPSSVWIDNRHTSAALRKFTLDIHLERERRIRILIRMIAEHNTMTVVNISSLNTRSADVHVDGEETTNQPMPGVIGSEQSPDVNRQQWLAWTNASQVLFSSLCLMLSVSTPGRAEDTSPNDDLSSLKRMGLSELMRIEVTSVSKSPEDLFEAASAIQVVTGNDIQRSGAATLPDALRLAPNLEVAQVNASQYAISARGFDNVLSNKLLVMIDGRSVYTPLYAGVFWDVQNVLLEDVDRIEVISGPGGTLWGANAVNGVINIISKDSKDTQGIYASASAGTTLKDFGAARYGSKLSDDLYFRVYGERFDLGSTNLLNGQDAHDNYYMDQSGFRMDWEPTLSTVTLQGDLYDGRPDPDGNSPVTAKGGNIVGRWKLPFSSSSDMQLQLYYDWTLRNFNNGFVERVGTYDADWQHRFALGPGQEVIWGLGYRLMDDVESDLPLFGFQPAQKYLHLSSAFVQDEITIVKNILRLTIGSKFEHNDYTGFDAQPSGRLAWTPNERTTVWGAISRGVRTPSRIERDFAVSLAPGVPLLEGDNGFISEKVRAYEVGWRLRPVRECSLSLSTFYNQYTDLRSATPGPPPFGIPITIGNSDQGNSFGAEFSADAQLAYCWQMRGGYTLFKKHLEVRAGSQDLNNATAESDDPEQEFVIQSSLDITSDIRADTVVRYVQALSNPYVPYYIGLDIRGTYRVTEKIELSIVGQNLLKKNHQEFVPSSPAPREIPRSMYGNATLRW
jgi:iron complex outermembrane receptor protein